MLDTKEKTAPDMSVGADEGQSSNNTTDSISKNAEKVKWLSDEKKIDEPLFCEFFCKDRELRCFNGRLYSIDGEIAADLIQSEIAEILKSNGITSGIAKKTSALFDALKLFCRSAPIIPAEDEIHVLNGVLKIDGRQKLPPAFIPEKKFCKNRLNIEYSEEMWKWADSPSYFKQFLSDLLEPKDILTLQEYVGYCLIPSTRAQTALFIIGNGGEGKSRLGVALNEIFGSAMLSGSFQKVEDDKFFRYNLRDKLVMLDDDMQMTALKTTGVVKNIITAEIPIDIEAKGKQSEQARLYCRFICLGNGSPKALYDKSDGFARRLLILSTKPKPPDRKDDPFLGEKLKAEKNKVFCWAFRGLQRLIANNYHFTVSERTKANVQDAIADNCNIVDFLGEAVTFSTMAEASSTALYELYLHWCEDNALTALKRETFIGWLKSNAEKYKIVYSNSISRSCGRVRGFKGISV